MKWAGIDLVQTETPDGELVVKMVYTPRDNEDDRNEQIRDDAEVQDDRA